MEEEKKQKMLTKVLCTLGFQLGAPHAREKYNHKPYNK